MITPSLLTHANALTQVIHVNEQTSVTLSGLTSADPDGDTLTYAWQQTDGPAVKLDSTTNPAITFTTPAVPAGQTQSLTFQLTVDDGHGAYDHTTLVVLVQHVNHNPILVMGKDITVMEGSPVTISGSATDPDNDKLTYSWGQFSGTTVPLSATNSPTLSFTAPMIDPKSSDKLLFLLQATDPYGGKAIGQIQVTVLSAPTQPATLSCTDITANAGDQVTLSPIISNPSNGPLPSYYFSQVRGSNVVFTSGSSNPSFTVPQPVTTRATPEYLAGQLQFVLFVNDGVTYLPECWLNVNIAQQQQASTPPPVANAGPDETVQYSDSVTLDGTASTGGNLQYVWTQTGGDPVLLVASKTAQPNFVAPNVDIGQTKTLTFQLTVSNDGGSNSNTVTITVVHPNSAPTAKITVQ
ncbi:MAG: hypothetical protein KGI27_01460 [Thaumarchaeota archaeon]|nr:hypothetical protein [Nitrososphaerota archaeon]